MSGLSKASWHTATALFLVAFVACVVPAPAHAQTPEFRAFWCDAFHDGFKTPAQVDQLMADVRYANCNAVVVQMRKRGNTYYPSPEPPVIEEGYDPSFDALAYLIDKAHNGIPRIEVHAWLCTLPVSQKDTPTDENHPFKKYPQYLTKSDTGATFDGSNYSFDPGHPEALDYIVNLYLDVLQRYDVDGIHFDYVRFAGVNWGYNDVSVQRFNKRHKRTGQPSYTDDLWEQWRRDQVTALVRKVYANAIAIKPHVKVSASTVTWGSGPMDEGAWRSTSAYSKVFQDWRAWMEEGILDINMPMCYFREYQHSGYYDGWIAFIKGVKYNRHCLIGPALYLNAIEDSIKQYRKARLPGLNGGMADGVIGFSYAETNDENKNGAPNPDVPNSEFYHALSHPSSYDTNPVPIFNTPVPTPVMPWKSAPTKGHIKGTVLDCSGVAADGVTVSVSGPENRSMLTDGTGFYAFIDLTPGTYTVTVTWPLHPTRQMNVEVIAGQMLDASFDICADPTAPVISNVRAENVGCNSADIKWETDDAATTQVEYGESTSYGSITPLSGTLVQNHTVALTGLLQGRTYHYRVRSKNISGFETVSGDHTFTTIADTTPPVISHVRVTSVTHNEAYVTWMTDDPASTQVEYGPTTSYGQSTTVNMSMVTCHNVALTGLDPNTTYHFRVKSTNSSGLTSYSSDGVFSTGSSPDIILDDTQATFTGTWTTLSSTSAYNGSCRQVNNRNSSANASATWRPNIVRAGKYDVYVWYPALTGNTTRARYTIYYSGGNKTTNVDQTQNGNQWFKIGTNLQFDAGTSGYVYLPNNTGETNGTRKVNADAVKFVYVQADEAAPSVPQNLQVTAASTNQMNLTWDESTDNVAVVGYRIFRNSVKVGETNTNSFNDTGLTANMRCTYTVAAYDAKSNQSAQSGAVTRYTLSAPPTSNIITCSRSMDTWYNTPQFVFTNGEFGSGSVAYYTFAWDNNPTHNWDNSEWTWAAGIMELSAVSGPDPFYFHVRGFNGDHIPNGTLDLGPYYFDSEAPIVSTVTAPMYLAAKNGDFEDLWAQWSGSDGQSGVAEYHYSIGTTPGAADVLGWTSAGTGTSAFYPYEGARYGTNYYFSVKARDAAGNWSDVVNSGASIYATAYDKIADATKNPNQTPVIIDQGKVVSAALSGCFYMQESDGARGLRVDCDVPWAPGTLVRAGGRLAESGGERYLANTEVKQVGSTVAPRPLTMAVKAIGGVNPDSYTSGLPGAVGTYNLGLLVRTTGRVGEKGPGYFVISDASGESVKVYSTAIVPDNALVGVTGAAGVESGSVRVIRTRSEDDVQVYSP